MTVARRSTVDRGCVQQCTARPLFQLSKTTKFRLVTKRKHVTAVPAGDMMLHTSSWLLCLTVAVGLAGERMTAAGPAPPALPLSTTSQMTLVFKTLSSVKPPDTPDGYSSNQMKRWTFQKPSASATTVPGYILITKNNLGGLYGTLTEMFYIPGMYKPVCTDSTPNTDKYYSAARVWVDNQLSQLIGRTLWGFPKVKIEVLSWFTVTLTLQPRFSSLTARKHVSHVANTKGIDWLPCRIAPCRSKCTHCLATDVHVQSIDGGNHKQCAAFYPLNMH